MLYAYERGNIIIIALVCSMFFVFFKDSENKIVRELSLILLAIAAGVKIYPAFLGMLLLYDKEYKRAARTLVYGGMCFFCPFFVFKEGIYGVPIFLSKLFAFQGNSGLSSNGLSFDKILNLFVLTIRKIFDIQINESFFLSLGAKLNYMVAIILLLSGFGINRKWKRVLACVLAIILYSNQGIYITVFMLLPLCVIIHDEDDIISRENIFATTCLSFILVLLPLYDIDGIGMSLKYLRFQVLFLIFLVYIIKETLGEMGRFILNTARRV